MANILKKWFLGTNIVGGGKLLINQNVDHSIVNTKTRSNMMSAQPSLLILQRNQLGRRDISERRGITLPWVIKSTGNFNAIVTKRN